MTRIIYVVYTKEYLTSRQIIGANLKKYAFLCDYSEVKMDDLIDSPMYSTPMQVVSISPCESLADTVVNGIPLKRIIISTINNIKVGQLNNNQNSSKMEKKSISCLSYSGYMQNKKEIKDFMLGQSFIKVVINMFSNIQVNGVNPMILAMAEDGIDMKDLMILQMMQGSNDGQMNPMFMMAMMDKGGNNSMIETMLMMQMMGNNQMSFPFMPNQSQKEEK